MKKMFFMMVVLMMALAVPSFGASSSIPGTGGIGEYIAIEAHPLDPLDLGGPGDSGVYKNTGVGIVTANVPATITCSMTPLTGTSTLWVLPSVIYWQGSGLATEAIVPVAVAEVHLYDIDTTRSGNIDPADTYSTTITLSITAP
jgi:hypothetical protein